LQEAKASASSSCDICHCTEIGIDPTVRHGADLGFIPIVIEDACGHGHIDAAKRSIENMRFMGDALMTDIQELRQMLEIAAE